MKTVLEQSLPVILCSCTAARTSQRKVLSPRLLGSEDDKLINRP